MNRLLAALALTLTTTIATADLPIYRGLQGSWYDPAKSGEGLVVELTPANERQVGTAVVYWFTYDDSGNQRWLLAVGPYARDSETIDFLRLPVYSYTGGGFAGAFDPADVNSHIVGQIGLYWSDCDTLDVVVDLDDLHTTLPYVRLTTLDGARCY